MTLRLGDHLTVIGHVATPGEKLGDSGHLVVQRASDGRHFYIVVTDGEACPKCGYPRGSCLPYEDCDDGMSSLGVGRRVETKSITAEEFEQVQRSIQDRLADDLNRIQTRGAIAPRPAYPEGWDHRSQRIPNTPEWNAWWESIRK